MLRKSRVDDPPVDRVAGGIAHVLAVRPGLPVYRRYLLIGTLAFRPHSQNKNAIVRLRSERIHDECAAQQGFRLVAILQRMIGGRRPVHVRPGSACDEAHFAGRPGDRRSPCALLALCRLDLCDWPKKRGRTSCHPARNLLEWLYCRSAGVAEWQTQRTQNPPGSRPCRFDSYLRHQIYFFLPPSACSSGIMTISKNK